MNHDNYVIFKGTKDGLMILLSEELDFTTLKKHFEKKVIDASRFFHGAKVALTFQGRRLSEEEQQELIKILSEKSKLDISFVYDSEDRKIEMSSVKSNTEANLEQWEEGRVGFYKGTIRSGQQIEFSGSVVIVGDVNPGGQVIAEGSIIVLGGLKGMVHAGSKGNQAVFVAALSMTPMQLRIGNIISRSPDEEQNKSSSTPIAQIAYIHQERICIEPMDGKMKNLFF